MIKYIRTFYNDEKVIIKLSGCQTCPMMKFDIIKTKCICRYFNDYYGNSVIDPFIINYTDDGIVNENIKIPVWCGLSDSMSDLLKFRTIFKAFKSTILVDANDKSDDSKLEIIDAEKLKNENDTMLEKFLLQIAGRPSELENDDTKYTDFEQVNQIANYGYQTETKKFEICSLCGEDDESVKRNNNIGMCDECWEASENDEHKKKQAFINNFRMKRDKDFFKESFKVV